MKTIYLTRHGKSGWDAPQLADINRPLNNRGLRDATLMGKRLLHLGITLDAIHCSPAQRTLHTSQLIAEACGYNKEEIIKDKILYQVSEHELLAYIKKLDDRNNHVMIVAHNPGITNCANLIVDTPNSDIHFVPTSGIVAINFNVESWALVGEKCGKFQFFESPKKRG